MCYCPKILLGGRIEMREKMTNVEPIKNKKDIKLLRKILSANPNPDGHTKCAYNYHSKIYHIP